ncbi:unnamed protein product [Candidula unifasciata]|uniref:receptor protein-tyrosine kinase n=1 Tax=Candidula unifasciata TaxID=100452 RepID=A0A8S3YMS9_9EUPU|nr:unnamed protein product [Candidula unifasciata]
MAHAIVALFVLASCFSSVVCVDLRIDEQEERECYGTTVGFGYSGTLEFHYQQLRKRYAGCTYIHGNLEITNILDPNIQYDLNFLKTIRYVSGYVLLGLITEVEHIPMDSLEVIRANNTYRIMGDDYSLVVVLTSRLDEDNSGLKSLHMPRLKEISYGKVLFTRNPSLGYVNTINWDPIVRGRPDSVHFLDHAFDESVSENDGVTNCLQGGKWGDDSSLCQQAVARTCHEKCQGRCFGPGELECCHNSCAVGCNGGSDELCFVCKDYQYENHCVGFCPAKSYPKSQNCVKY